MKQPVPFGKYTLLERISVGGMAEVFRAKTFGVEGFERLVAVKRILPNIAEDKEFIRMFVDEAKLAVQLNHANIAQITDLGVVDGSYYIAIEHVHGRDLRSAFDRMRAGNDAMPVSHACYAVMKVCEGLDYAHNKRDSSGSELGLVHRDVSPQNVLISFEGEVKLIDFGIAKAVGSTINTQSGVLKGKIGYMSPEQVRGLPVDRRADVFSCGIVLYEMLTGERLFVGESDFSTLEKVRNVEIPLPTTYNVKIPEELERIVLRALARDVGPRYQHAIDLHDDLQAFVYTAGEFCSRKDMAAWMKRTFAREIEEETAKLEAFRQMQATPSGPAGREARAASPSSSGSPPIAAPPLGRAAIPLPLPLEEGRRTKAMGSPGSKPPPPPGRTQQIVVLDEPSSASSSAKLLTLTPSGALPALPASPPRPGQRPTPSPAPLAMPTPSSPMALAGGDPNPRSGPTPSGAHGGGAAGADRPAVADPTGSSTFSGPAPVVAAAGANAQMSTPSAQMSAAVPPVAAISAAPASTLVPAAAHQLPSSRDDDDLSEWDDDEEELETQIYDNDFPESEPVPKTAARGLASKQVPRPASAAQAPRPEPSRVGPRPTSSQPVAVPTPAVSGQLGPRPGTARPEPSRVVGLPPASRQVAVAEAGALRPGTGGRDARDAARIASAPAPSIPPRLPAAPSVPIPQLPSRAVTAPVARDLRDRQRESELSFAAHASPAAQASQFGRGVLGRPPRSRSTWLLVLGGAALVIGGVSLALTVGGGRRGGGNAPVAITDDHTGFDLYVIPAGITRWRLDGELRTDRLPSRIRGIAPGAHAVVIEAPPGFMSQSQSVVVQAGQAQKVVIELPVMEINGFFRSDPDGANVTIIADGERKSLGPTPATFKLDPRKTYQVLFEKPGYVSANRPVTLSGLERESITVVLEKADGTTPINDGGSAPSGAGTPPATSPPPAVLKTPPSAGIPPKTPPTASVTPKTPPLVPKVPPSRPGLATGEPTPKSPSPAAGGEGTLQVSAKPPCEIIIDGKATGLSTPQREILLSVGTHRVTLVNQEFGISETFSVDIKADAPAKLVKDFSERLPGE